MGMKKADRFYKVSEIKYELAEGVHTYTRCKCGRNSTRSGKCWECLLEELI